MSGRVRGNVDTLERAFPLSSVSVSDCSTTFRACKFNPYTQSSVSVLSVASSPSGVPRGAVLASPRMWWRVALAACVTVCAGEASLPVL